MLGDLPDVTRANSHYFAYSDCGIFGNYFFGNEIFTRQMNYCGVCLPTIYGHYINDVEVIRGRNHLYNTLLNKETPSSINADIGQNMLQLGRRLPRSEIAKRVAHIDNYHMKHLCYQWFYDAEPTFTNWGPIESMSACGSYKYFKINTMSTVSNAHHTLFTWATIKTNQSFAPMGTDEPKIREFVHLLKFCMRWHAQFYLSSG